MAAPDLAKLRIDRPDEKPRGSRRGLPRGTLPLLLLALAGGAVYLFWPRLSGSLDDLRAVEVRTGYTVRSRPGADLELTTASGYVVARTRAALAAKVAGRLVELRVDVGSRVKEGELIARIDARQWRHAVAERAAAVEEAKGQIAAAEVRVEIARRDVERMRAERTEAEARLTEAETELAEAMRIEKLEADLAQSGSGLEDNRAKARAEVERLQAARVRQQAQLGVIDGRLASATTAIRDAELRVGIERRNEEAARARLERAEADLADTEIRAPFSGVVLRKEAEVGEIVVPALAGGTTSRGSVVTMADFSTLELEVDVFERDIRMVRGGAPASILINAIPGERFAGHVRQVVPTADRGKGTVQVKVAFDAADPRVLPEMGGKVVFLREEPEGDLTPQVTAPTAALTERDGEPGVFLVDGGRARFVAVRAGERRGDRRVIEEGLEGGERVVLDPAAGLADGTPLKLAGEP